MNFKRNPPERYSVIVIPANSHETKRWEIPRWYVKAAMGTVAGLLTLTMVAVWGWVHYRSSFMATEDIRVQNVAFDQERAALLTKLASLEQIISRVDRFATKMESHGDSKDQMLKDIGPISEDVELPQLPSLAGLPSGSLTMNSGSKPNLAMNDFKVKIDGLKDTVDQVEQRLQRVYELRQDKMSFWASVPSVWPVQGWVTSGFGYRHAPLVGGTRFHEGIDIAGPVGTPIKSPGDGVVTFAGYKNGLGKCIVVDHGYGVTTMYGHNADLFVAEGERIKRGSVIAAIGMTGRTTGPHLHYQVMVDGVPVDPMKYLTERF